LGRKLYADCSRKVRHKTKLIPSSVPEAKLESSNLPYKTKGCVFRSPFFMRSRIVADAVCVDVMV